MNQMVIDWGNRWSPVNENRSDLERQLRSELAEGHPLHGAHFLVVGRCNSCDDIAIVVAHQPGDPEAAVVHLTYGSPNPPEFPYFERMTTAELVRRFVEGEEHL